MAKVLAINGSPRGVKGNTQILLDAFLKGMVKGEKELELKTLITHDLEINHCKGCFTCWNVTPGKCIWEDDMPRILQDYLEADVIIYVTPLYCYGMTASLKKLIERLLPLIKPYMIKKNGHYTHPRRYKEKSQRHVLISNCGFPERHHFDTMTQQFKAILGEKLNEMILCTGGEMLGISALKNVCSKYVNAVEEAGFEFISYGGINAQTHEALRQNFADVKNFVDVANTQWNVPGELPPSQEETHGNPVAGAPQTCSLQTGTELSRNEIFTYVEGMAKNFNPAAAKGIKRILQMEFIDIGEACFLNIENGTCTFSPGKAEHPTTTIRTPAKIWHKIGQGELQGPQALMDGLYSVHGDFNIMMKMNDIFPSAEDTKLKKRADKGLLKFISPMVWLSVISFIPWYIFWFTSNVNTAASAYIPLLFSTLISAYRKMYIELTSFDIGNIVFFATMFGWQFFDKANYTVYAGIIGSIGLAVIWYSSLMTDTPTTAWYAKYGYSEDIAGSSVFLKTNQVLTVFWAIIFLLQAVARLVIPNDLIFVKSILVYGVLIIAGMFTSWFVNWYPVHVMTGKK